MKKFIRIATFISVGIFFVAPANADMFDDRLAKAQTSVENAQKRLAAAQACVQDRAPCIAAEKAKIERAAKRLAKQQADMASVVTE